MPRHARKQSSSGIYHIVLRGINRQNIFEDEEDKKKFLETLDRYKAISEYKLFAYCLMSNHIHLLIRIGKESLDTVVKRIAGSYVYWYNWKYSRCGHLFQDRFKSEPVEEDSYFLTALRYIHQNPVRAGVCKYIEDYRYSSYLAYIKENSFVDTDFCFGIIDCEQFIEFHNRYDDQQCLELDEKKFRLTDEKAMCIIQKVCKCKNATEFQQLDLIKRDKYLKLCREKGISIRQLSRLTGVSFHIIRNLR